MTFHALVVLDGLFWTWHMSVSHHHTINAVRLEHYRLSRLYSLQYIERTYSLLSFFNRPAQFCCGDRIYMPTSPTSQHSEAQYSSGTHNTTADVLNKPQAAPIGRRPALAILKTSSYWLPPWQQPDCFHGRLSAAVKHQWRGRIQRDYWH